MANRRAKYRKQASLGDQTVYGPGQGARKKKPRNSHRHNSVRHLRALRVAT